MTHCFHNVCGFLKKTGCEIISRQHRKALDYQHHYTSERSLTRDPYEPLALPRQTFGYIYPNIPALLHETE